MPKITNTADRLYGNWLMLAPDGTELCRCSEKKYRWYASRGLAEQVNDKNIFKLNFWPKGKGHAESSAKDYYLGEKQNVCVVCGTADNLTKHHVVPTFYRKHFPHKFKARASHDLVLICVPDHFEYENEHACKLSQEIAIEMNVPINAGITSASFDGRRATKIAYALLHHPTIPPERSAWMREYLTTTIGHEPSESELITLSRRRSQTVKVIKSHTVIWLRRS